MQGVRPQDYKSRDMVLYENAAAARHVGTILPALTHGMVDFNSLHHTDTWESREVEFASPGMEA